MCMVTDNLKLVSFVIKKYFNQAIGTPYYDDLFQEGCIGLMKAADVYDESTGYSFTTIACKHIWGNMKRFMRNNISILHVPRPEAESLSKIRGAVNKYGYDPVVIAEKTDLDVDTVKHLYEKLDNVSSLDKVVSITNNNNAYTEMSDLMESDINVENEVLTRIQLNETLNNFDERTREILKLRYFKGLSQGEISKALGLSQPHVSRLLKKAVVYNDTPRVEVNLKATGKFPKFCELLDQGYTKDEVMKKLEITLNVYNKHKSRYNRIRGIDGRRKAV